MTSPNDFTLPKADAIISQAKEKIQNPPPEIVEAIEKSKSFIERNKPAIITGIVVIVGLKFYKRKIVKTTTKAVVKAMAKDPVASELPGLLEIYEWLKRTPGMSYIAHGGKMLHLLGPGGETVVTLFNDFDSMPDKEVVKFVNHMLMGYGQMKLG